MDSLKSKSWCVNTPIIVCETMRDREFICKHIERLFIKIRKIKFLISLNLPTIEDYHIKIA